jgi:hypothetical protein
VPTRSHRLRQDFAHRLTQNMLELAVAIKLMSWDRQYEFNQASVAVGVTKINPKSAGVENFS